MEHMFTPGALARIMEHGRNVPVKNYVRGRVGVICEARGWIGTNPDGSSSILRSPRYIIYVPALYEDDDEYHVVTEDWLTSVQ